MSYTYNRTLKDVSIENADKRVRDALATAGFGILTEIDIEATMKTKLGADMAPYRILGACNPQMAFKALQAEPRVGTMLPCNVILRKVDSGTEISAIDPVASMQAIENDQLHSVAKEVRDRMRAAIDAV
ncbi:DUF302 domain-containing protein [Thioclava sp.]|uniref:DUF302 domain-containing protein n=1 Tax=Thioclava sp. TaxID=1933450 RepID=UPI003AA878BF